MPQEHPNMADDSHIKTYDVSIVASNLPSLHEYITRQNGRIELTRPGSDERCVLIAKEELTALEEALEILSATDGVRDLRHKIAELAAATGPKVVLNA